ncbi:alpha/beta hydrolase [Microvirga solisilvae]|uniref:alpha/beta hydrolase n=1 Tax=Microvirga solisilvae TaxID=2919498 RepID=UPI001FB0380E|nr:hypothetical protein [Microvirga solisilvae]
MKQEKLTIAGRQGVAISGTLIRQDRPSRRLAILFPGLTYRNSMPVLYYPRQLLLERGYEVLTVDYSYDQIPDFADLPEDEKVTWIGDDARAVMDVVSLLGGYEHFTLVGKSLGTAAMAALAPDEPSLASADLVWLTPGFKTHGVLDGMARCPQRSIIVLGTADPHYEAEYVEAARARGAEVALLPGLDHGLETPGDVIGSVEAMAEVMKRLAAWLDQAQQPVT